LISNYDFINTTVFDRVIYNFKFDHSITANNRVSFTVTKEDNPSDVLQAFPGAISQGLVTSQKPDNWRWNHDLVIKPTMLLHTTFGYSRTRQLWTNPYQKGGASKFGFPGITGDSDAMPRVIFNGPDGLSPWGVQDGKVNNGSQINITYHFNQALSIVHGKHDFKMGGDVRHLHTTSSPIDLAGTNGRYQFARAQTALPTNLTGTGHAFASMLLGLPDSADRVATPVIVGPQIAIAEQPADLRLDGHFSSSAALRCSYPGAIWLASIAAMSASVRSSARTARRSRARNRSYSSYESTTLRGRPCLVIRTGWLSERSSASPTLSWNSLALSVTVAMTNLHFPQNSENRDIIQVPSITVSSSGRRPVPKSSPGMVSRRPL